MMWVLFAAMVTVHADWNYDESALETDDRLMLLQSSIQVDVPDLSESGRRTTYASMFQQGGPDDDLISDGEDHRNGKNNTKVSPDYVLDSDGGSNKIDLQTKSETREPLAIFYAAVFVLVIASTPLVLQNSGRSGGVQTLILIVETLLNILWLTGGLYLCTQVLLFQSPRFGSEIRSLTLIEAVYLFTEILTTVGSGDIMPATPRGQVIIGLFVILSTLFIFKQFATIVSNRIDQKLDQSKRVSISAQRRDRGGPGTVNKSWASHGPVCGPISSSMWSFILSLLVGTMYFHFTR
jgi:hypothetical protein